MKNTKMEARLSSEVMEFIRARNSLQLATVTEDGTPYASYAPFAFDEHSFFVLLSDVALHGLNMRREPRASVLLIEDEQNAEELFARIRVNYQIRAEEIPLDSSTWEAGVTALEKRHGSRPRRLSELEDFRLFRLHPIKGRFVKGFGRAYSLAGDTLAAKAVDHLTEGHRTRASAAVA